tara:strand:+ start:919 stop:2610 length:1692 start_codon:yes stop_codon:yes gene_type:complete
MTTTLDADLTALPETEAQWRHLFGLIPKGWSCFRDAAPGDYFDEAAAVRAIGFFHRCIRHVKGKKGGELFLLERWQQAVVAILFGWMRADGTRRFRRCLLYVPRKNGKTPFVAALCIYMLACDGEPGAEVYSAAKDTEQAALIFAHAKGMVRQEPELSERLQVFKGIGQRAIAYEETSSMYRVLDGIPDHGLNSHFAAIDEVHQQKDGELMDVLDTSTAARSQPMVMYLTTADFHRESACNTLYKYATDVAEGTIEDREFLPVIYEASLDDDWTDEAVWADCNPNLGVSLTWDYMRAACKRAQELPSFENTFKRLHLNIQTEQDKRWIPMVMWDRNAGNGDESPGEWRDRMLRELEGEECYGGLDLASTNDLCSLVLTFVRPDASLVVLPFHWVPEDGAREREKRDRVPYTQWIREGLMTATEGEVADYDVIRKDINALGERYNILEVAFDRWGATQIQTQLTNDGVEVVQFGQGMGSMSPASKEFERLLAAGRIRHGGNPLLKWQASNVAIKRDAAENIKPDKAKSTGRIDAVVATIMTVGRIMIAPEQRGSVYKTRGLRQL